MKVILESPDAAAKLCGEQKRIETQYRPSLHSVRAEVEDGVLLYHTLTCELLHLTKEEAACPTGEVRERLIRRWFLVPVDFDEKYYARQIRKVAALIAPKKENIRSYTVFTTTDCNARCYYCYEKGVKRVAMTADTAHRAADFIARKSGGKKVSLCWFGGEPLYNAEAIQIITRDLTERGISFTSKIVTNGLLFTPELVRQAREEWGLYFAQITVDGTEKVYNRTKAYIDRPENAFERVMTNIGLLLDSGVQVSARMNVDRHNAEDLHALTDLLARRFGGREGFHAYPVMLTDFNTKIHDFASDEIAVEEFHRLKKRVADARIGRKLSLSRALVVTQCMADDDGAVCITPEGYLTKCEHFTETERFGSIYTEETDQEVLASWKEQRYFPECDDCPFYPTCVNLKKCEWRKKGCSPVIKESRINHLKKLIVELYQDFQKEEPDGNLEENR